MILYEPGIVLIQIIIKSLHTEDFITYIVSKLHFIRNINNFFVIILRPKTFFFTFEIPTLDVI